MKHSLIIILSFCFGTNAFGQKMRQLDYLDSIHHLLVGVWYNVNDPSDSCHIEWDTARGWSHETRYKEDSGFYTDPNTSYSHYYYYLQYDTGSIERSKINCFYNTIVPLNNGKIDTVLGMIYSVNSTELRFDKQGLFVYKRK